MTNVENCPPRRGAVAVLHDAPPVWVVTPSGDVDAHNVAPLIRALECAMRDEKAAVVDCSNIGFADSSFLNALLQARQYIPVHLAEVPLQTSRLLELTHTVDLFHLHPDVASALARFNDA
ncbi:STAS domain-containing protein [Streptomyces microflavus]|uniref:STAS domain-containing protein n=1 Tax=Streptomyces microflavus TaxID=1919 RepID=UPI003323FFAA